MQDNTERSPRTRKQEYQHSWYVRDRDRILKRNKERYAAKCNEHRLTEDSHEREACVLDPRKIRDVAGDDWIVCPGTPQSWCGRLFSALTGPHLKKHYPQSGNPAFDLRKDWGLPKQLSLMSKSASARNAASIKVHPFTNTDVARAAGQKGGKAGGKLRPLAIRNAIESGAHKGPRPGGRHPVPKKQKFPRERLAAAVKDGYTIKEIAATLGVRGSSVFGAVRKLGLDTHKYSREKQILSDLLAEIGRRYRKARRTPDAQQIIGWCVGRLGADGTMPRDFTQFLAALKQELTPEIIEQLVRGARLRVDFFPLTARILRRTRIASRMPKRNPWRPAQKETEEKVQKALTLLQTNPHMSYPDLAREVDRAAWRKNPRNAGEALRKLMLRMQT